MSRTQSISLCLQDVDTQQFWGQDRTWTKENIEKSCVSKAATEKPCCSKHTGTRGGLEGECAGKAEGASEKSSEQAR